MSQRSSDWIEINLPTRKQFIRFICWVIGRILLGSCFFTLEVLKRCLQFLLLVIDWCKTFLIGITRLYEQLPYNGTYKTNIVETTVLSASQPGEIITDIVSAIDGKQLMIIGEMGTGKSTLAQYLAYTIGGQIRVYEPEGTPEDWVGLEVIGKGENWDDIGEGMQADLEDLSNQIKLRLEHGDNAINGNQRVIIGEEYPEIASKVEIAGEWLERHARRGRKARRFLILLSQYDRVSAWGLEGKYALSDAFFKLRLGKTAVNHAKSLKDDNLVSWLLADRTHCLLNDSPCKLPNYREMKLVTSRLLNPAVTGNHPQSPVLKNMPNTAGIGGDLGVTVNFNIPTDEELCLGVPIRVIRHCLAAGMSESEVIKKILGCDGGSYQKGRNVLAKLRSADML